MARKQSLLLCIASKGEYARSARTNATKPFLAPKRDTPQINYAQVFLDWQAFSALGLPAAPR